MCFGRFINVWGLLILKIRKVLCEFFNRDGVMLLNFFWFVGFIILRMISWFFIFSGIGCSFILNVDLINFCGIFLFIYCFIKSDFFILEFLRKVIFNLICFWLLLFFFKFWMILLIVGFLLGLFLRYCRMMFLRGWRLFIFVSFFFWWVCFGIKLLFDKRK